ncbi:MAG: hypothetical protein AVO35_01035 [Candidatus Aegiribacteria sp. MLS_C]|nr:MAG: hypothetical protein AVO35_01035 [Candidatus Aegiribacteria sp. MLS_C]
MEGAITGSRIALNWIVFNTWSTGAARRAYELHRRMPEDLEFTAFVTRGFSREWRLECPGIRFVEVSGSRSFLGRLREGSASYWSGLLKDQECGLWVTDTLPVPSGLSGTRTCITVHDLRFLASRNYLSLQRYLLMKHSMGRSLERADAVVAVSQWTAQVLLDRYPVTAGKLSVVENSVDPEPFRISRPGGSPVSRPYIFSVGHLETRKNFERLVEAFGIVSRMWDGNLVLVGGDQGSLRTILENALRVGVSDRLMIRHDLDFETLVRFYRNAELVVCPSKYEGFGITLLEGMASGRAVAASDIPPHREVAGEAALYFHPDDTPGMADAMLNLARDRYLRESLVQRGDIRLERFSWERSAQKLASLYRELLGR